MSATGGVQGGGHRSRRSRRGRERGHATAAVASLSQADCGCPYAGDVDVPSCEIANETTHECHADTWLTSRVPVCSFGGERQPDVDEGGCKAAGIRPLPYRVCLHRIQPEDGSATKRAFVDVFSTDERRWLGGNQRQVLPEYAVYIQGPFTGFAQGKEQLMIWDRDGTGRENLKRISNLHGIIELWNLTGPDGEGAEDSKFGRELSLSICVIDEADAKEFVHGIMHQLLGAYYREEASRLGRHHPPQSGSVNLSKKAHSFAAHHTFSFYNLRRSDFEVDLRHLRIKDKEAENYLKTKLQQIAQLEVDAQEQEKYLEVIVGREILGPAQRPTLRSEMKTLLYRWSERSNHGMRGTCVEVVSRTSFLVVYAEYEGELPCYGWFYCSKCHNVWQSLRVQHVHKDPDPDAEEEPAPVAQEQDCSCGDAIEPVKLSFIPPLHYCRKRTSAAASDLQRPGARTQGHSDRSRSVEDAAHLSAAALSSSNADNAHTAPESEESDAAVSGNERSITGDVDQAVSDEGYCLRSEDPGATHNCQHRSLPDYGDDIDSFGGERFPEPDGLEEGTGQLKIRSMPFFACLHERLFSDQDRPGDVHMISWDDEAHKFTRKEDVITLKLYSVFVRGPFVSASDRTLLEAEDGRSARRERQAKSKKPLTARQIVRGAGGAGWENIRRISKALQLDINEVSGAESVMQEVEIVIRVSTRDDALRCLKAVKDQIHGIYYRKEARRLDNLRRHHVSLSRQSDDSKVLAQEYASSLNDAHDLAAVHIFKFFNEERSDFQVDLHQLRVYGEEAGSRLRDAMLRVSKLEVDPEKSEKYLEVIAGKGIHSENERHLWPAMLKRLEAWRLDLPPGFMQYEEPLQVNEGSMLVRFQRYRGVSPCWGWLYDGKPAKETDCQQVDAWMTPPCDSTWKSFRVFVSINENPTSSRIWRQRCDNCYSRNEDGQIQTLQWVEPVKLASEPPVDGRLCRYVPANQQQHGRRHTQESSHDAEVCELCMHLGYSCDRLPRGKKLCL